MIYISDAADAQISALCTEHNCYAISLGIKGGGCAGFEYEWGTIPTKEGVEQGSWIFECEVGHLVVEPHSHLFLFGTELDYVKSLVGSNFEIRNPNAKSACGCGVSVNFDFMGQ